MKLTQQELNIFREISIHRILHKTEGRRIQMRCPFPSHGERTPSFTVYPDNSYYCYGCGAHGRGAIDFCRGLGFSFVQSVEELIDYI